MVTPELKDRLGLRDLERIAAEPIEPIIEDRHTPARAILGVTLEWIAQPEDIGGELSRDDSGNVRATHHRLPKRPRAVEALERSPSLGPDTLVVVDRNRERTAGRHEAHDVFEGG